MTAFVLGNGVSRQGVDLDDLARLGEIYGCNALYREYRPRVLVATDAPIAREIQESGYSNQHQFYTRRPLPGLGAQRIPDPYFGFSSGPVAVALASQAHNEIWLLGFDLGPDQLGRFNNVYAGTNFYKPVGAQPTFAGNWVKQLCKIFQTHPGVTYTRVMADTTAEISDFAGHINFRTQSRADFLARINNSKGQ